VLHARAMLADAYATALTVMGPAAALAFAAETGLAALVVSRTEAGLEERLSPALTALVDA
jgi:thiamine biosynthesis lipoprotein